jgi:hypothetical protein
MSTNTFDEFNSSNYIGESDQIVPFAFRKSKLFHGDGQSAPREMTDLEWLNLAFDARMKASQSRMSIYRRHMNLFKGVQWSNMDARDSSRSDVGYDGVTDSIRKPKVVVNFINEMIENKLSARARDKVAIALIPQTASQVNINNAKSCKLLLDARADQINLDGIFIEGDRVTFIFGHSYTFVMWDKNIGPMHPIYEKLSKQMEEGIPVLDPKTGKEIKKLDSPVKTGDVDVFVLGPDRVFPDLTKTKWKDVDDIFWIEWMHLAEAQNKWPNVKNKIVSNDHDFDLYYDYDSSRLMQYQNYVCIKHYFHRKTQNVPHGKHILFVRDTILFEEDCPYEHGELPCIPDTDIDVYGEQLGRSFITNVEQLQRHFNNIASSIARNHGIGSAPKWMVPKGACTVDSLNNEFVIVQYAGPREPKLVQSNPTGAEIFNYQDKLEAYITKMSGVYDISRGEPPKGVTANSALRFLDEQETQRGAIGSAKRKERIRKTYRMMMALMSQYYDESDNRTAHILGKDNSYLIKSLKDADFSKVYDIKIQNTSSLPDTKTGKISAVIDLNAVTQTDPVFRRAEIVQMLELGLDDAYKDQATIAATAARSALDSLLNSEEVPPPELYDDLLTYYDIFLRALQERSYKDTGPEIKKQIESYIKAVEMLMYERARKNSMFAQKMAMVDMFPIFFTIPQEPPPMAVAGMTNAMEEQTMGGVAPKENPEAGMQMAQMAGEEQPTEGQ